MMPNTTTEIAILALVVLLYVVAVIFTHDVNRACALMVVLLVLLTALYGDED